MGPGRRSEQTGELIPVDVAVGDVVLYSKYGGTEITVDGEDLLVLSSRDVLAKVAGREEEVALTTRDPGARGGRQRIPRPATARAGAAAPWASRRARAGPDHARPGARPLRRLRRRPRARCSSPEAVPPRCSLPLFEEDGEARLVLTRRPETMPSHRGEIAFPGGKVEPVVDRDARDAALREAEEEIGLRRETGRRDRDAPDARHRRRAVPHRAVRRAHRRPPDHHRRLPRGRPRLRRRRSPSCSPTACYHEERWSWALDGSERVDALLRARGRDGLGRHRADPHRRSSPRSSTVDVTGDWDDWTRSYACRTPAATAARE